jgi:hypothetical protein
MVLFAIAAAAGLAYLIDAWIFEARYRAAVNAHRREMAERRLITLIDVCRSSAHWAPCSGAGNQDFAAPAQPDSEQLQSSVPGQ